MSMNNPDQIREALLQLPGEEAQYRMAPALRRQAIPPNWSGQGARKSAVLILLYPQAGALHTVLMKRVVYRGVHSGQISFPGGKQEPFDPDLRFTALRETEEEIGVESGQVDLLGSLSPLYVPASHSHIQPYVGYMDKNPVFRPDPREVAGLLTISLAVLFDDAIKSETEISLSNGLQLKAPYYAVDDQIVWGATAMIISELEVALKGVAQGRQADNR